MIEPQIRYAKTSDGVNIAYWAIGNGPSLIATPYQWASHIALEWDHAPVRTPLERLATGCRLVRYDRRGSGLSDRDVENSAESEQADLRAVVDSAALPPLVLLGRGFGAPAAIRFAVSNPGETAGLVLYDPVISIDVLRTDPRLLARTAVIGALVDRDVDALIDVIVPMGGGSEWWSGYFRGATDRAHYKQLLSFTDDVTTLLSEVQCPTLVIKEKESAWGGTADKTARAIAKSELSTVVLDDPEAEMVDISARVFAFLGLDVRIADNSSNSSHGTAVILFADIVDSTALTERLGDSDFRERARQLSATLRKLIRDSGGSPVEGPTLGDGMLATFSSARQAIEAALAVAGAGDAEQLPLHLGLHAGDVLREKDAGDRDNVYGGAVNVAARISGLSGPGEVLVSETVRSLARTSAGVRFEDRGEQVLKGVGEPVRVWAVREGE